MESIGMSWGGPWSPKDVLGSPWNALGTSLWVRGTPSGVLRSPLVGSGNHHKTIGFSCISIKGCTLDHILGTLGDTWEAFGDSSVILRRPCALRGSSSGPPGEQVKMS